MVFSSMLNKKTSKNCAHSQNFHLSKHFQGARTTWNKTLVLWGSVFLFLFKEQSPFQ